MSVVVALNHKTEYYYPAPSVMSPQVIRLRPAPHTRTKIENYSMAITPSPHFINWQQDPFGNHLARVVFPEPIKKFVVDVNLVADLTVFNPFDFFTEPDAEEVPFFYSETLKRELGPYLICSDDWSMELEDFAKQFIPNGERSVDYLVGVTQAIAKTVDYEIRYEPGVQEAHVTLTKASGSCRDSAWLMCEVLRKLGFATRFTSGYLIQLVPDNPKVGGGGTTEDFTDLHAWCEVYLPGAGWVGFDPTSGLAAGEGHIPLCATPEPTSAAAISGSSSVVAETFHYSNTVTRLLDEPRSTRPYTDSQWVDLSRVANDVDKTLDEAGVKLTMGGEPTFVSVTDLDAPEWNTEADGADKRGKAAALASRLAQRFAPDGLVHHGQGKWYPGEELPRWKMTVCWRNDRVPLWNDQSLLASPKTNLSHDVSTAKRFGEHLCEELGIGGEFLIEAHEDPVYDLWAKESLPVDVDVCDQRQLDPEGRSELIEQLAGNVGEPVGVVIPLDKQGNSLKWLTSTWPLRRSKLFLTPGDSEIPWRLPLDSLPKDPKRALSPEPETDPQAAEPELRGPIGSGAAIVADPIVVRKAVSISVVEGVLRVALPPLSKVEHAIDLLAAIERACVRANVAITIGGYPIPADPRVTELSVTPDPGVIEVNLHPAESYSELARINKIVFDEASAVGLATEKFHVDGRHTGTGGGSHITLGGPSPSESPLLRDPQLLCSIVRYWQNHPSLSYVFNGLFVGPTSQAPRVDEARLDHLAELELALSEVESADDPHPWLADRALRHLLTDLTGNTHRAELCIDKLFSPDHPSGRLGLLELRAFEMPPHYQMSMATYLLVRAIVARLAVEPYRNPLVRWGNDLHDRMLLPHYLATDLTDVCTDLRQHGLAIEPSWFEPFFAFRFPRYGSIVTGDVTVELRAAIEPWLVLGEEVNSSGVARYVDSSMERLQVKTYGLFEERYCVRVNNRTVPLRATGRPGEFVAGVKYRAWDPPSALHPTIGVHTPLLFEVVDKWSDIVVGSARYHVSHPGGRAYDSVPVNSVEAESRRSSRFENAIMIDEFGHHRDLLDQNAATSFPVLRDWPDSHAPRLEHMVSNYSPTRGGDAKIDFDFPSTLDLRKSQR